LKQVKIETRGPGSAVGIATDYELDGPGSNPGGDENLGPSRPALPASCTMGTGSFPGVKAARAWGWPSHLHLVYRGPTKSRAIPLLTLRVFVACKKGWNLQQKHPVQLAARSKASATARLLRLWVRIPPGAWMSVCCECCVYCELITRPEESYRLWRVAVCDLETTWMWRPWPTGGPSRQKLKTRKQLAKPISLFRLDLGSFSFTRKK
jgi:hypothetical protein